MLLRQDANPPATITDLLSPSLSKQLDRFDIFSRKVFAGHLPGERRSKRKGESVEFDDYRTYTPGDDLRRLDWNAFARFDRFYLKLFRAEEDLSLHILVDCSASMLAGGEHEPTKMLFAHRLAMGLAAVGLAGNNRVSLGVFGCEGADPLLRLAPVRGRRQQATVGRFLLESYARAQQASPGPNIDRFGHSRFERAMRAFALSQPSPGVVIVITDGLEPQGLEAGLSALTEPRTRDCLLLQTLAPSEREPEKLARAGLVGDLRLTDAESNASVEVTMAGELIGRYKTRLREHIERVAKACSRRDIAHVFVSSDAEIAQVLTGQLRRRSFIMPS